MIFSTWQCSTSLRSGIVRLTRRPTNFIPLSVSIFAVIGATLIASTAHADELTDGREILTKTFTTYLQMSSYTGRSNSDSLLQNVDGHALKQFGSSVEMKFKRPNKLRLDFVTPTGSRTVWSSGTELGVYDPSAHKYWMSPSAPTMEMLLPLLYKHASIAAYYDPLYGISRNTLPSSLKDIRLKNKATYNGHPVYVIIANMTGRTPSEWTWWVDRNTLLIYKVEQLTRNLKQNIIVVENGKRVQKTRPVNLLIRNVITDARPNAQTTDSDFQYKPPPGSSPRIDMGSSGK